MSNFCTVRTLSSVSEVTYISLSVFNLTEFIEVLVFYDIFVALLILILTSFVQTLAMDLIKRKWPCNP